MYFLRHIESFPPAIFKLKRRNINWVRGFLTIPTHFKCMYHSLFILPHLLVWAVLFYFNCYNLKEGRCSMPPLLFGMSWWQDRLITLFSASFLKSFFYPFLLITKHTLKSWNEWLQIQKINSLMMSSHKGQAS